VSVQRGHDPRDFVLVACGGGGAMHAAALGAELRVKRIVIPPLPGTFSAWGMLVTEPRVDVVRTQIVRTEGATAEELAEVYAAMERDALDAVAGEDGAGDGLLVSRALEMRYVGQEHTVTVPLDDAPADLAAVEERFHRAHERLYTFALSDTPAEIVTFHLVGRLPVRTPQIARLERDGRSADAARKGERTVDFDADGMHRCTVLERGLLPAGFEIEGPAIVEEPSSTTLVHPGQHLRVDDWGNLLIDPAG
jgi:N-methylhydantoinase A